MTAYSKANRGEVAVSTLHTDLRRATHAAHVRLNQHPLLSGLTKPGYDLARYRLVLAAYYHLYAAIEARVDACLGQTAYGFNYAERRKLPWLLADLACFDIRPTDACWSPLRPVVLPEIDSLGALIGVLYTIEGATLGGQVIARHLRDNLGLTPVSGARFFSAYGDAPTTAECWRAFLAFAACIEEFPEQCHAAELAALVVFELIEEQLDEYDSRGQP